MDITFPITADKVLISTKVLERVKKDKYIKQNLSRYISVIRKLMQVGRAYKTETIGDFFISPRGGMNLRIAWYEEGGFILIYDFLYEKESGVYIEKWNDRAREREITRDSYKANYKFIPLSTVGWLGI